MGLFYPDKKTVGIPDADKRVIVKEKTVYGCIIASVIIFHQCIDFSKEICYNNNCQFY